MSTVLDRLQSIGGAVEEDELRYQCERRGLVLNGDLEDLEEKGLVERIGTAWQAVVPKRVERRGNTRGWTDEEMLDRVRLWAVIVGRPPTFADWHPSQLDIQAKKLTTTLRKRLSAQEEIRRLFEAGDWPGATAVRRHFGSLNAALVIAGFEPRQRGGQPSELRPVHRPGPKAVGELVADVEQAREDEDRAKLRESLYQLAVAALTEADRL